MSQNTYTIIIIAIIIIIIIIIIAIIIIIIITPQTYFNRNTKAQLQDKKLQSQRTRRLQP
jgi:flagellar basal body-associated protein FliL